MGSSSITSFATMNMAIMLLFTVFAVSSALDMSIMSYDNAHSDKAWLRTDKEAMSMFEQWMVREGKVYSSQSEKEKRFRIFKDNLRYIDQRNSLNLTYNLGLTPFADLTNEEFRAKSTGTLKVDPKVKLAKTSNRYAPRVGDNLPNYVDWRQYGAVSPVKNQGQCLSCWAFSANGAVEGLHKLVTGQLISLSEQELVDCNQGCTPGYIDRAYDYIINHRGITAEAYYPYTSYNGVVGYCDQNKIYPVVGIDSYEYVPSYNEAALKTAVAYQPVSAAVEGYGYDFQHYTSGIFTQSCGTNIDHAILVIGYGSEYGQDYWIIKNSWGTNWGESGFMRLQRNVPYSNLGKCGIAIQPLYPVIWNGLMKPSKFCNNGSNCAQ